MFTFSVRAHKHGSILRHVMFRCQSNSPQYPKIDVAICMCQVLFSYCSYHKAWRRSFCHDCTDYCFLYVIKVQLNQMRVGHVFFLVNLFLLYRRCIVKIGHCLKNFTRYSFMCADLYKICIYKYPAITLVHSESGLHAFVCIYTLTGPKVKINSYNGKL